MEELNSNIRTISKIKWDKLAEKRIYFGHQSVGSNIMDGIKKVQQHNPQIKLNIKETVDSLEFSRPIFAHSRIGENHNPQSKNKSFLELIEKGVGEKVDVAFFKYCYVDIKTETHINELFDQYKIVIDHLKKKYPHVLFIHITVPIVVVQNGFRTVVKKIMKREIGGYKDNIKRNNFNTMIRNHYHDLDPVFDLSDIESTYIDGRSKVFKYSGTAYRAMVPEFASDGRHLNNLGQKIVAEQLLVFLANLID